MHYSAMSGDQMTRSNKDDTDTSVTITAGVENPLELFSKM